VSFLAEKYILREGNKVLKEGEINERLFEELNRAQIRKAIFIGKDAIYYESSDEKSIMVSVDRNRAGFAKIIAKKLFGKKLVDLSSIEEAFEFAERVKDASLEDLAKLR